MSEPLAAGQRLGEWTLEAPLGRGGMAEVWRAASASGGNRVALKVLFDERAEVPAQTERFLREARTGAALRHPGVVAIVGAGRDDGRLWLAMELLQGEDLAARIKRGALHAAEVIRIARAVTGALAFAHERGVLHRDVKSANVFLTSTGEVKLLDLGIARAAREETMTATGELLGTMTHLAPELARGERASPRSDLYALGVTLFECLAGRLPFQGNAVSLVMHHARSAPPRVRSLAPSTPDALDGLIDRLLSKDPAARPATAAEVLRVLESLGDAAETRAQVAAAGPLEAALAEVARALAAQEGEVVAAEASLRAARTTARAALSALQAVADRWLTEADGRHALQDAEARWVAARDGVEAAWRAVSAARACRDDASFQAAALRARVAEVTRP